MLAGKVGQALACTYFELRVLPEESRRNNAWQSWMLSPHCHQNASATADSSADNSPTRASCWRSLPGVALKLKPSLTRGPDDPVMDALDEQLERCSARIRFPSLDLAQACATVPPCKCEPVQTVNPCKL